MINDHLQLSFDLLKKKKSDYEYIDFSATYEQN